MSNFSDLLKRYGPSFCVSPWNHFHLCDTGVCKICCAAMELRNDDGTASTIYQSTFREIWNSKRMREIRRAMVHGEKVLECGTACSAVEDVGGLSMRIRKNKRWEDGRIALAGVTLDDLKQQAIRDNFYVNHAPFDLDLEIDNACNLKCRMCGADRSSRIGNDAIHSRWYGKLYNQAVWEDNALEIGPKRLIEAKYTGFIDDNDYNRKITFFMNKYAEIELNNIMSILNRCILFFLRAPSVKRYGFA